MPVKLLRDANPPPLLLLPPGALGGLPAAVVDPGLARKLKSYSESAAAAAAAPEDDSSADDLHGAGLKTSKKRSPQISADLAKESELVDLTAT